MKLTQRWIIVLTLIFATLPLSACATAEAVSTGKEAPAIVEPIADTGFNRVILTEKAAQRLDIQTAKVRQMEVDGKKHIVVPYASIIYGLKGETWVYINPAPLTFTRQEGKVDHIDGDNVYLIEGPDVDTSVATVGVAELYGTDAGVGK